MMSGIIFPVCSTSAFSALSLLRQEFQLDQRHRSTGCSQAMSKRTQEGNGEESIAAKSRPMTNLVSRCRVWDPTVLASTASENPVNTKSERQKVPLSSLNVQQTGTGKPVTLASSSNSSEWNNDDKWSSQVRKSGEMSKTSTGKLVSNELVIDIDMDSDTATESDLSLKSRSFLNRENDRLRKMLNRSPEDSMQDIDKRSMIWYVYIFDIGSICVHGKESLRQFTFHQKYRENLTLKKTIEISEQLMLEQSDEIFGVSQISWESSPWKQLSVVSDEEVVSLSHAKVYVFSDSVLCLGTMKHNPISNTVWEQQLDWFKDSSQYRTLDTIDGEPMEFEWNIFPANPNNSKDELSSCRCSMTSYHAAEFQFERFRVFLELISRFEFEFRRCENSFSEGFELITHTMWL